MSSLLKGSVRISFFSSLFGMGVSLLVLNGWLWDIPELRSLLPGFPSMVPMTAFCIWLLSTALFASTTQKTRETQGGFALPFLRATSVIVVILGFMSLAAHLTNSSPVALRLLPRITDLHRGETLFSGLMSIQTSLIAVMLGLALLLRSFKAAGRYLHLIQFGPLLGLGICLIGFVGYLHDVSMSGPSKLIGLSLAACFAFFALCMGTLNLDGSIGLMGRLRSESSAGFFMKWFTAGSLFIPILVSFFIQWGEDLGLYPPNFSLTLLVIFMVICLMILGVYLSYAIQTLEDQRIAIQKGAAREALRESEESLQATKDRLELALAASRMGIWDTDLSSRTTIWSPMVPQILGYTDETELPSVDFFEQLVHPDDLPHFRRVRDIALEEGREFDADFRLKSQGGEVRWIRCKGRARKSNEGSRVSGTLMDITSEKSYQEALEKALEAAESANKLKTSFLANMSHEIRTPLGAILGFTDLLGDPETTASERDHYLQVISRNGKLLSQLLNDILDLSKVESGHLNLETIRFKPREAVDEVTSLWSHHAQEKGIELEVEVSPEVPTLICTDLVRFKQILMNLLGNAVKFTQQGKVSVRVSMQDRYLRLEVEDTGIGIAPSHQEKLFRPFSQGDDSMTRRFGGSGLGLLLSRKLASLLGGNVELVRSAPGKGSLFRATIANTEAVVERIEIPSRELIATHRRLEGVRVLLVEDALDNQYLIRRLLQREGARVEVVGDGEACLRVATNDAFDLILMDIQMPVMDGLTATRILREGGFVKPIVALTAHAMNDVRMKCEEVGCQAHLAKPIDVEILIDTVVDLVQLRNISFFEFADKGAPL